MKYKFTVLLFMISFVCVKAQQDSLSVKPSADWERIQELIKENLGKDIEIERLNGLHTSVLKEMSACRDTLIDLVDANKRLLLDLENSKENLNTYKKENNKKKVKKDNMILEESNRNLTIQIDSLKLLVNENKDSIVSLLTMLKDKKDIELKLETANGEMEKLADELSKESQDKEKYQELYSTAEGEIASLNVLKKERIASLSKEVSAIVNSGRFSQRNTSLDKAVKEIQELSKVFPDNDKLRLIKSKSDNYYAVAYALQEATSVLNTKYSSKRVYDVIELLNNTDSNLSNANTELKKRAKDLGKYCTFNNAVYDILLGVDIYGKKSSKLEDINLAKSKIPQYGYLLKALDSKVSTGYPKGTTMVNKEICPN